MSTHVTTKKTQSQQISKRDNKETKKAHNGTNKERKHTKGGKQAFYQKNMLLSKEGVLEGQM